MTPESDEAVGEIDLATAGFRQVEFFDCSGLRVPCRAESRAQERGGRLRVATDSLRLHRLLRASGLWRRFPPLLGFPEFPEKA
ncbi:STAS domain-containing protein [Streptomyces canus]|uniref:STAS domain-containing protein n=1 Tax=Streptomyces canus TaxID=58343 RepID=UPI0033BF6CFF